MLTYVSFVQYQNMKMDQLTVTTKIIPCWSSVLRATEISKVFVKSSLLVVNRTWLDLIEFKWKASSTFENFLQIGLSFLSTEGGWFWMTEDASSAADRSIESSKLISRPIKARSIVTGSFIATILIDLENKKDKFSMQGFTNRWLLEILNICQNL